MDMATLILKKHEERRLRAGHLWVYSNEVDTARTPLTGFEPGQTVRIEASDGKVLGAAYVNPHSLICARLVSRHPEQALDRSLLTHRLNVALSLRERVFDQPYYRLVHGEGDALPGLIVDRYGDVLVAQFNTAGMERVKQEVVAALEKVLRPRAIVLRNDGGARALEGLERCVETVLGESPDEVEIEENGARFGVSPLEGQKTGWFFDHRLNRERTQRYARGKRVLDVFSYIGAWGIEAAVAGAQEVVCVESSERALDRLASNAERNGVDGKVSAIQGDAFDVLRALRAERERFDVVVVDPPAFIKRKKDVKEGTRAYRRLNQMAMQLLGKDGILASGSCSYHLRPDVFTTTLLQASRHLDRSLQIVEQGHQGPDHPVHPAIAETDYLKFYLGRVVLG